MAGSLKNIKKDDDLLDCKKVFEMSRDYGEESVLYQVSSSLAMMLESKNIKGITTDQVKHWSEMIIEKYSYDSIEEIQLTFNAIEWEKTYHSFSLDIFADVWVRIKDRYLDAMEEKRKNFKLNENKTSIEDIQKGYIRLKDQAAAEAKQAPINKEKAAEDQRERVKRSAKHILENPEKYKKQ